MYSWLDDTNAHFVRLDQPVKASRFRLAILNTSAGAIANDPVALKGKDMSAGIHLREVEIYGVTETEVVGKSSSSSSTMSMGWYTFGMVVLVIISLGVGTLVLSGNKKTSGKRRR